ncbi:hypothetical protein CDD83_10433 [Cordyceps sp. RAO-2017]|nr:hypothetical protein CDD83_10433 [Cordyceps sp. RAO-2017]
MAHPAPANGTAPPPIPVPVLLACLSAALLLLALLLLLRRRRSRIVDAAPPGLSLGEATWLRADAGRGPSSHLGLHWHGANTLNTAWGWMA